MTCLSILFKALLDDAIAAALQDDHFEKPH
jgi:hypothetical protein